MSVRWLVLAEDRLAFDCATALFDRVVAERSSWLRDDWATVASRENHRTFTGVEPGSSCSRPQAIKRHRLRIQAQAGEGVAAVQLRKMRAVATAEQCSGLLVTHDTDHDETRELRADSRNAVDTGMPTLVAEATPEFDAWVLSGFLHAGADERQRLEAIKRRTGLDPTTRSHELTSTSATAKRDAKELCTELLDLPGQASFHHERVRDCLVETPLQTLEARGKENGLANWLDDVAAIGLPAMGDERR